jgi:predicted carbohydrate-binding protein with CBM5 and CBM33 domain
LESLQAAIDHKITVAEVTYQWVIKGAWNIADCAERYYDVEGMHVGQSPPAGLASRCCAA